MDILYIGELSSGSTSAHRAEALHRLGHNVSGWDPWNSIECFFRHNIIEHFHRRTGYVLLQNNIKKNLLFWLSAFSCTVRPDLIWVNGGELFGKSILRSLKFFNIPIILYNNDDPTGRRDKGRFISLLSALNYYDHVATCRLPSYNELVKILGQDRVQRIFMSYDEVAHQPLRLGEVIPNDFLCDVSFSGTWMRHEKRHLIIEHLLNAGFRVNIYGNRWHKSPFFEKIKPAWKRPFVKDREYVYSIVGAKINLGLLSKGNRDQHTTRSMEIPFAGGLLCAERTREHQLLYREDKDAVFWSSLDELLFCCRRLLANTQLRESIRLSGMARIRDLGVGNELVCSSILERALRCNPKS